MKVKVLFFFMVALCIAAQAEYEYRLWTDKKGNAIEAKYVRESTGKVSLIMLDGKSKKVLLAGLSEADHHYVELQNPPDLEIECAKIKEIATTSIQTQFIGSLKKSGSRLYTPRLDAHLYLNLCKINGGDRTYCIRKEAIFSFQFPPVKEPSTLYFESRLISEDGQSQRMKRDKESSTSIRSFFIIVTDELGYIRAVESNLKVLREQYEGHIGRKLSELASDMPELESSPKYTSKATAKHGAVTSRKGREESQGDFTPKQRHWIDTRSGNSIAAEFVKESTEFVWLKKQNGGTVKIPRSRLAQNDLEYIQLNHPPKFSLKIQVSVKGTQREFSGMVKSNEARIYDLPLDAYILFRKRTNFRAYDHHVVPVEFTTEQIMPSYKFTHTNQTDLKDPHAVLVLVDKQGTILAIRSTNQKKSVPDGYYIGKNISLLTYQHY